MAYWWCLEHGRVEGDGEDRGEVRLGPYDTEAQAARALETLHERDRERDAQDEAWRERGERSS